MTRLIKLHIFLNFWFSPWGAAKGSIWESISRDMPYSDDAAEQISRGILDGTYDTSPEDWDSMKRAAN